MKNRYPRKSHYLVLRKSKDGYRMKHVLTEEKWTMPVDEARFIKALDGKTNPYKLGYSRAFADSILDFMEEEELLDDGERKLDIGIGSALFTVYIPDIKLIHRFVGFLWNHLLMVMWLPILILGLFIAGAEKYYYIDGGLGMVLLGIYGGMAIGLIVHELSHAAAALNYGGSLLEMGVMVRLFLMMGAYCLIDYDNVRDHFKRAQISAAGPESNLLLCGVFLCMLKLGVFPSEFLIYAGGINCCLALLNLALVDGLDGSAVFEKIFGCSRFVSRAFALLFDKGAKRRLKYGGITGRATLAACYMICTMQALIPMVIFMQVVSIIVSVVVVLF